MREKLNDNEKNYIYILKALAIFCVVCAHSALTSLNASQSSTVTAALLSYLGTMGVPVFFVVSGFFFDRDKRNFGDFWKRKAGSIILPWLFCETFLWLYICLRKGGVSVESWALFMIGYQHTTYYLTMLLIFYLLFRIIRKEWQLYLVFALSFFSIISTGWGGGLNFINDLTGTFYLNPINWCSFFIVGIMVNRKNSVLEALLKLMQPTWIWLIASIVYFIVCTIFHQSIFYFSKFAVVAHVINILLLGSIALKLNKLVNKKLLIMLGTYSFSIYLLHQFVSGIIVNITSRVDILFFIIIRPFSIIAIVFAGIYLLCNLNEKCHGKLNFAERLVGIR